MRTYFRVDLTIDLCINLLTCVGMWIDMRMAVCAEMCMGMRLDAFVEMRVAMSI